MELVYTTSSMSAAREINDKLEAAGIPAVITGENVAGIQLPFLSNNLAVFIYINNQYDDAMLLISNPEHQVSSAVDVEAFYSALNSKQMKHYLDSRTNYMIVVLSMIIVFILLVIIILD